MSLCVDVSAVLRLLHLSVCVLSGEASSGQQPADYLVGQVSGSLFQKNSAASGSSLSALFGTAAPAAPLQFQPAPKVNHKYQVDKKDSAAH